MRRSVLSRSVIAVASLAIGSVALAAVPATADTPSGITREQVLAAAAGARSSTPTEASKSAREAILRATCDIRGTYLSTSSQRMIASDGADGVLMTMVTFDDDTLASHFCKVAAFATVDPTFELSGTVTIDGIEAGPPVEDPLRSTLLTAALSGNVFVTAPLDTTGMNDVIASAAGTATRTTTTPTATTVTTPRTTSQKKAAKKTYDKQLASAKKAYKKAIKKAASSKSKKAKAAKAKAKKTYAKKKATARTAYKKAIANVSQVVNGTTTSTVNLPFVLTTRRPGVS